MMDLSDYDIYSSNLKTTDNKLICDLYTSISNIS